MKNINYKFLLSAMVILLIFSSCSEREYHSKEVRLSALIPYLNTKGTSTSDSGIKDIDSDEVLEIALARIDQNFNAQYPSFVSCGDKLLADMQRPDPNNGYARDIEFTEVAQFFRNDHDAIKYAAWYPNAGSTYNSTATATTITFPINGSTDVMYSTIGTGSASTPFTLMQFKHALCVYRIYVYAMLLPSEEGSEDNTGTRWRKITSMSLNNMNANCVVKLPLSDGVTHEITYGGGTSNITLSDPSNNIYYNPGDTLPLGIANKRLVSKCIAAPPSSGVLDISVTTEHANASQQVSIARNFQAGCAYDIILRFSDHGFINAEVSVGEWDTSEDDIDRKAGASMYYHLSTYGTANSYMIYSGNYGYSFDGTVMGNGDGSLVGVPNTTINPGYIDILWTDMEEASLDLTNDGVNNPVSMQTVSLVSNQLSLGKILVKVQGNPDNQDKTLVKEGNVIIGAYTDASKTTLLWTWHLWLCDRVRTQGYTNGYSVQDRNLGAVSNQKEGSDYTKMYGLYYQWGRPTPFEDPDKGDYLLDLQSATTTPSNAISSPLSLFGTGNTTTYSWLNSGFAQANNLWGWTSDATDPKKTIYDPCPYGYMVSDYRMWKNMSDYEKQGTYVFNYDENGAVNVSIATNNIFYPIQGYLDVDGDVNKATHPLYIWSNSISNLPTPNPYYFTYDSAGNSDYFGDGHRNIAAPVRCIASRGVSVVKDLSAAQTANCYMIHKDGYYKFKATIRGNGVGSLFPLGGDKDAEIKGDLESVNISPDKVDVLWWQGDFNDPALTGTSTDPQNLMCIEMLDGGAVDSDGYVLFNVNNFHKGNTILAAYDDDGNILWTWHIWLTDVPADISTGKYSLMDRFLGATFAPTITAGTPGSVSFASNNQRLATYGFYYQWGRKDPIPGPPLANSGDLGTTASSRWWYNDGSEWVYYDEVEVLSAASIADVTAYPMAFYNSQDSYSSNVSGWYPSSFADGYVNVVMWGYAVADWTIQGQTFSKTMHDPCPPGYRTPFHYAWDGEIPGTDQTGVNYRYIAASEAQGFVDYSYSEEAFDSGGMGIVLNKTTFSNAWYPFTGYRNATTGYCTDVGTDGRMFTGMPMEKYNTRYYQYDDSRSSQRQNIVECGAAYAFSIRCQKE